MAPQDTPAFVGKGGGRLRERIDIRLIGQKPRGIRVGQLTGVDNCLDHRIGEARRNAGGPEGVGRVHLTKRRLRILGLPPLGIEEVGFDVPDRATLDAYAAVEYHGTWYWIDDRDFAAKRAFTFLMMFFSLAETGVVAQAPVLTIPAN